MNVNYLEVAGNIHLSYYIAAADKLGIKYEIIRPGLLARFQSTNSGKHWFIINTVTPLNNVPSSTIARRKNLSYEVLKRAGFPVAYQEEISGPDSAAAFLLQHKQIVLKPVRSHGGKGVVVLPQSEDEAKAGYELARSKDLSDNQNHVLGERFVLGTNYRLLVLEDRVIGAVMRNPASVIGDGVSSIETLIERSNVVRRERMLKPIPLDVEFQKKMVLLGLTAQSVPQVGETVSVRLNANLTTGGTTEECLAKFDKHYLDIAVGAVRELGLGLGGVDLIAQDISNPTATHVINEINFNPGLRLHYKVDKGEIMDVALPIMQALANRHA